VDLCGAGSAIAVEEPRPGIEERRSPGVGEDETSLSIQIDPDIFDSPEVTDGSDRAERIPMGVEEADHQPLRCRVGERPRDHG
jgi:hypothetical protein